MQVFQYLKLMKLFLLVVQHVFLQFSNLLKNSLEEYLQKELIPMKLLLLVLLYRVVFLQVK